MWLRRQYLVAVTGVLSGWEGREIWLAQRLIVSTPICTIPSFAGLQLGRGEASAYARVTGKRHTQSNFGWMCSALRCECSPREPSFGWTSGNWNLHPRAAPGKSWCSSRWNAWKYAVSMQRLSSRLHIQPIASQRRK